MESNPHPLPGTECVLSVVIPAYREGRRLFDTVEKVESELIRRYPSELILVDDGGGLKERSYFDDLCRTRDYLRVLHNTRNRGKGHTVKKGVLAARGDFIFYTDADLAYDLAFVPRYLEALRAGGDLAIGCRIHSESLFSLHPRHFPYIYQRHLMGATYNRVVNGLLGLGVRDTQCGFKCFRRPVARALFSKLTIPGFAFEVEMLFLAVKYGYEVREMPVRLVHEGSPSSVRMIKDSVQMFGALWKIRHNDRRGVYDSP